MGLVIWTDVRVGYDKNFTMAHFVLTILVSIMLSALCGCARGYIKDTLDDLSEPDDAQVADAQGADAKLTLGMTLPNQQMNPN